METDKIHFKLNDFLQPKRKFPIDYVSRIKWTIPEPLYVLCSHIANYLPEEPCFKWTNMHVLQWIESLGFPQYRNTFYVNMINGRTLLLLDASALQQMNIEDFDHIKIITAAVRKLYKIELVLFKRSISLPPRYPDIHFKFFRVCTGPTYERTKRTELWTRMRILQERPPQRNHWHKLHEWLQHQPQPQWHRIGYANTLKLYKVQSDLRPPLPKVSSELPWLGPRCDCIPPCECSWQPWYYREPWTLRCLLGDEEAARFEADEQQLADGDIVLAATSANVPEAKKADKSCSCLFRHECHWTRSDAPIVLTVIRSFERIICEDTFEPAANDLSSEASN